MKTLVIAEAGVNHNGDLSLAMRMIDAAADAGADLVKFQTFRAKTLATPEAGLAAYQLSALGRGQSQHAMLKALEMDRAMHVALIEHCKTAGVGFLSTGFSIDDVSLLVDLGQQMFKIPSGELTNLLLLRHVGALGGEVILSTGMATLREVEAAIRALEGAGTGRALITVLHCTTDYPAAMPDVNLRAMCEMSKVLRVRTGYSDHTLGIEVATAAVALGATVIEKHFTLDRHLPGPDQRASLEPAELAAMVRAIRNIESALGDGIKRPSAAEAGNAAIARRSLVAKTPIAKGEHFSADNLDAKRPGTGISPMRWDDVVGRKAKRAFRRDELIDL